MEINIKTHLPEIPEAGNFIAFAFILHEKKIR